MEYGNFDASETDRSNNRINSDWQLRCENSGDTLLNYQEKLANLIDF